MYLIVIILIVAMYWYYSQEKSQEKFMAANWTGQYGAQTIRPVMSYY